MDWSILFPRRWWVRPNETEEVQVEREWLQKEVPPDNVAHLETLHGLKGWRNREVYEYLLDDKDWTKDIKL